MEFLQGLWGFGQNSGSKFLHNRLAFEVDLYDSPDF